MSITPIGIVVGTPGTFQAIPEPAGSIIPTGIVPIWSSSDVTIATVATPNPDPTGLTTTLTGIASGTVTLTVEATLADGTIAQGSVSVPVTPGVVKSFTIVQNS